MPRMQTKQILLVENDPAIAESIRTRLDTCDEFRVDLVPTGYDALRHIGASVPDAVLIDLALPDLPGSALCRLIRSRERTAQLPVMILEERGGSVGPISALELGADDYLTTPFDAKEVEARLKALLRRHLYTRYPDHDCFSGVHLKANFAEVAFSVNGQPVRLTKREFVLLRCLIHHRSQVVGRNVLLANVWDSKGQSYRSVNSAIHRLRAKLREAGRQIETVAGFGYRFNEPPICERRLKERKRS
jgi:DNA-binding response OmpR family regulator